ncbi:unnamed protein product [Acanthoscelides obtectus]|uniref:Uncharacterized protein n=1 Tax=Acanthoscelides obtectus TaxID=200917 RepID=A0A9P0MI02_ACAOB|nr:unnamed protein product [Acanthoscelides obtectus]CAK1623944.1 hypothetical protein AOBTE_LOCUS2247 [Acanthoscelides obtectus]
MFLSKLQGQLAAAISALAVPLNTIYEELKKSDMPPSTHEKVGHGFHFVSSPFIIQTGCRIFKTRFTVFSLSPRFVETSIQKGGGGETQATETAIPTLEEDHKAVAEPSVSQVTAGRICHYIDQWSLLTCDKAILQ